MKRKILVFILSILISPCLAQLDIDQCHDMARQQYPLIKQYDLLEKSEAYTLSNAMKAFLPEVKFSFGANGFTDPINSSPKTDAMGMGDMKNYLLNGSIQINQLIYDGGAISAQRKLTRAQAEADKKQLDVRLYEINQRVDQLYFGILMIDEQSKQLKLLQNDLTLSLNTVQSLMNGGLANQSDVDAVKVEQLRAAQQESSLRTSRKSYIQMLGLFIGKALGEKTTLEKPTSLPLSKPQGVLRPELSYYAAQQNLLDTQRKSLTARLLPQLSAFAMGMYHNKVLDMMKPAMLAGGITLSWKISPFYTRKNDLRSIETKKSMIDQERETFLFNIHLQNEKEQSVVEDLREKLKQDDEIIRLRENIHNVSVTKVQNGIQTINEMLRDVNAVNEARQQKSIHEIQLLEAMYQLKNINNN
ncbi:TolC family protein [Hoylesella timonensis]|uniref:Transporter n=1 Tax=Hoylesella timonensis TaxID=386414 RepID=A0A2N6Q618_9BACT|nr:TolC family protein [Hoylesella timonensis]PMC10446.1 transporter [Hoylesella timonensis]